MLFEVLAAIVILLVGVLGTVAMIDGANATTARTKAREAATNLARELIETSRSVDYDKVTEADLPGQLQSKPGLADSSGAAGWQIQRRGVEFTITETACVFDDATDKAGTHDSSFCTNSATTPTGDDNPDDYRKVVFTVSWIDRTGPKQVAQTAILGNPSGGLGPRITDLCTPNCTSPTDGKVTSASATAVDFEARSTSADTVHWSADDGGLGGDASGGPTVWTFPWYIGTVGSFSCGSKPSWTLDGTYLVSAQAFDFRSIPGDLKSATVQLDRSHPAPPCGLDGGRNGSIVDLQWLANNERDIAGYEVFRVALPLLGESSDPKVCDLTTATSCYDPSPPSPAVAPIVEYYVRAHDATSTTDSAHKSILQAGNVSPLPPSDLTASVVDGQPVLSWTPATDPDGSIQLYRIYRDGVAYVDRYDATSGPQTTYTDRRTTSTSHSYWVTAVDDKFAESSPIGPVAP